MKRLFEIDKLMTKSLTKQVCDGYRSAIMDGRLAGGERFPTCREICDEFGVSMIVSPILKLSLYDEVVFSTTLADTLRFGVV